MSTVIRSEISKVRDYYIPKERYYELKHFCLQYPTWKHACNSLDSLSRKPDDLALFSSEHSDPTVRCVLARDVFLSKMKMIEDAAFIADPTLADYILEAVTTGASYNYLLTRLDIPCSKENYYKAYRQFFWELSKIRN